MSIVLTEKELKQVEKLLGEDFVTMYEKIWDERSSVRNYLTVVNQNIRLMKGAFPPDAPGKHSQTYWEYKRDEVELVLTNQSRWLRNILDTLEGKISKRAYSKIKDYIKEHDVLGTEYATEQDYDELWRAFDGDELEEKKRYIVSGKILKYILDHIPRAA